MTVTTEQGKNLFTLLESLDIEPAYPWADLIEQVELQAGEKAAKLASEMLLGLRAPEDRTIRHRVTRSDHGSPPRFCHDCGRSLISTTADVKGSRDQWTNQVIPDTTRPALQCDKWPEGEHDRWIHSDEGWLIP